MELGKNVEDKPILLRLKQQRAHDCVSVVFSVSHNFTMADLSDFH